MERAGCEGGSSHPCRREKVGSGKTADAVLGHKRTRQGGVENADRKLDTANCFKKVENDGFVKSRLAPLRSWFDTLRYLRTGFTRMENQALVVISKRSS